jgi:ribosomal protein S1
MVKVTEFDLARKRIALSIKQTLEKPATQSFRSNSPDMNKRPISLPKKDLSIP